MFERNVSRDRLNRGCRMLRGAVPVLYAAGSPAITEARKLIEVRRQNLSPSGPVNAASLEQGRRRLPLPVS